MKHLFLITADQLRWDHLGANNSAINFTPNLDGIACEGINFQQAYSPNPICVPARLALLTGQQPHKITKAPSSWGPLNKGVSTLPAMLGKAGYATGAFGKMHFLPYANPRTNHGFAWMELNEEGRIQDQETRTLSDLGGDDYARYLEKVGWGGYQRAHGIGNNDVHLAASPLPTEHYESAWVVDRALAWHHECLQKNRSQKTFSWLSFTRPHAPFDPPEPYHKLLDPRKISPPVGSPADLASKNPALSAMRQSYGWESINSPQHSRLAKAYYGALVHFIDEQIGRLIASLKAADVYDDSCIIFTADHGEMLGDFGLFFKSNHLEGSCKVPLIIKPPRFPSSGPRFCEHLVGLEDVAPTFLDIAGIRTSSEMDGESLLSTAHSEAGRPRYFSHTVTLGSHTFMIRERNWKYIWSEWEGFEELYDLAADPNELCNIAPNTPSVREPMRRHLSEWLKNSGREEFRNLASLKGNSISTKPVDPYSKHGIRWN